jgi:BON domain
MKTGVSQFLSIAVLALWLAVGLGCAKAPSDADITGQVQSRFEQDSGLSAKTLNVQSANGTVTLSGAVDSVMQRDAAARQAATVPGVKQVVNNLEVVAPTGPMAETPAAVEKKPSPVAEPRARPSLVRPRPTPVATTHVAQNAEPSAPATAAPAPAAPVAITHPAAPVEPPKPQKVTIPSGTNLAIRLVDPIDSETAQAGQSFRATLDSPISLEGDVVIPSGYDVTGHVVDVKSAGKFAGKSELILQLDRIAVGNKSYTVQTNQYERSGSSRGKNTAAKVGTGAAIGAIIGGIAGGGKGAAIGAAAGGGVGGGVQAATKGQQIQLPSETVLNFTLQASLTVVPAEGRNAGRPKIEPTAQPKTEQPKTEQPSQPKTDDSQPQ